MLTSQQYRAGAILASLMIACLGVAIWRQSRAPEREPVEVTQLRDSLNYIAPKTARPSSPSDTTADKAKTPVRKKKTRKREGKVKKEKGQRPPSRRHLDDIL